MSVIQFTYQNDDVSYLVWYTNESKNELLAKYKSRFENPSVLLKLEDDMIIQYLSEAAALEKLLDYHKIYHLGTYFNNKLSLNLNGINWNLSTSSCPEFAIASLDFDKEIYVDISLYNDIDSIKNLVFNSKEYFLFDDSKQVQNMYYSIKKIAYNSYQNQLYSIKKDVYIENEYIDPNQTINGFVREIPFEAYGIPREFFVITYLRKLRKV